MAVHHTTIERSIGLCAGVRRVKKNTLRTEDNMKQLKWLPISIVDVVVSTSSQSVHASVYVASIAFASKQRACGTFTVRSTCPMRDLSRNTSPITTNAAVLHCFSQHGVFACLAPPRHIRSKQGARKKRKTKLINLNNIYVPTEIPFNLSIWFVREKCVIVEPKKWNRIVAQWSWMPYCSKLQHNTFFSVRRATFASIAYKYFMTI